MRRQATLPAAPRRTSNWLPEGKLDAVHPLVTSLLETGVNLWISAVYQRTIMYPDGFQVAPGTLIIFNHQRDVDGPMLGIALVRPKCARFQCPLPSYAAREDLFRPGILARLTVRWPRPVSALLGHVSLDWFFPLGRAEPMRRVREFTLGETLRLLADVSLGDTDAAAVLNPRGRRETGVGPGDATVRDLGQRCDSALESWWGLRRLKLSAFAKLTSAFRATVSDQLGHFAARLDHGSCMFFAPEGTISKSGYLGRVRAGLFRLAHMTEAPPWVQPIVISYDTLAPGRSRVIVRMGERFRADTRLERRAFDRALRQTILSLEPITASHLTSRYLLHGPPSFTHAAFTDWFERGLAALRTVHPSLDPLLASTNLPRLTGQRLRWLEHKGVVARQGHTFRNTCPRDAAPGWRTPANIARYLDNVLNDLVPDSERVLRC